MGNFYTDVIKKDPRFKGTNPIDDVALLEPVTRKIVQDIIATAAEQGIKLMPYETYRSQARQTQLFKQKATKLTAAKQFLIGRSRRRSWAEVRRSRSSLPPGLTRMAARLPRPR